MMKSGLCSISLQQLGMEEIIALVQKAGLDAIEWAGNAHVQPGEIELASKVRKMTEEAGLEVSSYGSYWKVVTPDGQPDDFGPVLESALALGTDTIRIWAGHKPSDAVTEAERETIHEGIRAALEAGEKHGVKLGLEFHANTLSDSNASTLDLLAAIPHANFYTYWQPIYWLTDPPYRMDGLKKLADKVLNMHVFHWMFSPGRGDWGESTDRRPLVEGADDWREYFSIPLCPEMEHYALMEFVRKDRPEQFLEDAAVLKSWLSSKKLETADV
ncbi:sugar phosphate isomerase/epimerase family protein [Pontiella sp.]|uniref:sugar phosphate isomerase/epimerase family protein n=1 Tax=Pontiella sp. TaxID=2837462 RepID=UPI0035629C2C